MKEILFSRFAYLKPNKRLSTQPLTSSISDQFINRWKVSGASERANYQLFLTELCELLGVEKPRPATAKVHEASYHFERPVEFNDGEGKITTNFIDLYKQHCFVLEAKQGSDKAVITEAEILGGERIKTKAGTATRDTRSWEREMKKAKEQALRYARSLPTSEGWPPFLVVVDVGFCIDLYADFARQGKTYIPFPDPVNYRIPLADLGKPEIQQQLRLLFTDPMELDPSKRAAKVTRELAERLAKLAALLEQSGHGAETVAGFLMRCLFTMFAEDVELLPDRSFTKLLQDYKNNLSMKNAAGCADIIVSRAGSTIFEIASWGIPSILVPITHSNDDHQRKNAYNYAHTGSCVVIEEVNMTSHILYSEIERILTNKNVWEKMKNATETFNKKDSAEKIAEEIVRIALSHEK